MTTPKLPWIVDPHGKDGVVYIIDCEGTIIADNEPYYPNPLDPDLAEPLVRAVNNHDSMLRALEAAQLQMEQDAVSIDGEWGRCRDLEQIIQDKGMPEAWELVVAAINRAKGKSE